MRRSSGEGTIVELSKGYFQIGIMRDGVRRQRKVRGSRRDAERALDALVAEVDGLVSASESLGAVIEERLAVGDLSVNGHKDYVSVLKHLSAVDRATPIADVNTRWLKALLRRLERYGVPPSRLDKLHSIISSSLQRAVEDGRIPMNPARNIKRARVDPPDIMVPEVEHLRQAIDAVGGWLRVWAILASTTGARRGELAAMRWSNVDFERNRLVFSRAASSPTGGGTVMAPTKTRQVRVVAIDPAVVQVLAEWQEAQATECRRRGKPTPEFVLTHPARKDGPRRPDSITSEWTKALSAAGVEHIPVKQVRHTVGSLLLLNGVDIRTVAGRLGNSPKVLLSRYAKFMEAGDQRAAATMAAILKEPSPE